MIWFAARGMRSLVGLVGVLMVLGCGDVGMPDDVVDLQEQQRLHRPAPGPTEMPPGLAADLPFASTQPVASTQPFAKDNIAKEN